MGLIIFERVRAEGRSEIYLDDEELAICEGLIAIKRPSERIIRTIISLKGMRSASFQVRFEFQKCFWSDWPTPEEKFFFDDLEKIKEVTKKLINGTESTEMKFEPPIYREYFDATEL